MVQSLNYMKESASQTAGPYVHIGCTPNYSGISGVYKEDLGSRPLFPDAKPDARISLDVRVIDGSGTLLRDALIEIWQADADGNYRPNTEGWGRKPTDATTGIATFDTVKPGPVAYRNGRMMAPHVTIWIVARGINIGLHTRMYFPEETEANAADPLLSAIEHKVRVPTLIGQRDGSKLTFDIHLQGPNETVFLDI